MYVNFNDVSTLEMSVHIREIYNRCVDAMGYSAIDLCYNDVICGVYDDSKQYFPFNTETIIEHIFATMIIDKGSLEVSQMILTDEVLGYYINHNGISTIDSISQQIDAMISDAIDDNELIDDGNKLVDRFGNELNVSISTPVEIIDFIAYFLYFFNQYFYASFTELCEYIIDNGQLNMSVVVSSIETYTDIFYRYGNPSPILGNILESNMLCNIYFDFDNDTISLPRLINNNVIDSGSISNNIVQSGDISWQDI